MGLSARRLWLPLAGAFLVFIGAWYALRVPVAPPGLRVELEVTTAYEDDYSLFYDDVTYAFSPERRLSVKLAPDRGPQLASFQLPPAMERVQGLRIDPATSATSQALHAVILRGPYRTVRLGPERIIELFGPTNDLKPLEVDSAHHAVRIVATGNDPYLSTKRDISDITAEAMDPVRPVVRPFVLAVLVSCCAFLLFRFILRKRNKEPRTIPLRAKAPPPSKKRIAFAIVLATIGGLLALGLANEIHFKDRAVHVEFDLIATRADHFQVFHAAATGAFTKELYVNAELSGSPRPQRVVFRMPADTAYGHLRFDPGNQQDSLLIRRMTLRCNDEELTFEPEEIDKFFNANEQVRIKQVTPQGLRLVFSGNDPFLYCDTDLRERIGVLQKHSGNGPLPLCAGIITALFVLLSALRSSRPISTLKGSDAMAMALCATFVVLLWLPLLAHWFPIEPGLPDTEKRPMAPKPLARMHSAERFPAQYTKYFGDHFGFRKMLFRWNSLFYHYVLRTSALPDNVVYGKDGQLFLLREGVADQYRGLSIFDQDELDKIGERLEHRRKWLADQGISYYLTVAPTASSIYPDKLPDHLAPFVGRVGGMDQLIAHLKARTAVPFIDLRGPLREARTVRDTYYATDIHWNPWGAFIGYRTLMGRIAGDHPEVGLPCLADDYIVEPDTNDQGDLALQLAINDKLTRVTYMMVPKNGFRAHDLPEEELPASGFFKFKPVFKQGPDPKAPRLLMFRDSFAVYLIPYMSEHFSRSVYVWSPVFIPDIVTKEKPDIVVQELLEVFITDLIHDKVRDDL